ncbi:MAG: universal stress protein, partial [Mariprofundus sp.]
MVSPQESVMIQHGKILVPTDFSAASNEALRRAGVMAAQCDAEVHLLHVME